MSYQLTDVQFARVWDLYNQGKSAAAIARHFNRGTAAMSERNRRAGGICPTIPQRADRHLTLEEREETSRGLAAQSTQRPPGGAAAVIRPVCTPWVGGAAKAKPSPPNPPPG